MVASQVAMQFRKIGKSSRVGLRSVRTQVEVDVSCQNF